MILLRRTRARAILLLVAVLALVSGLANPAATAGPATLPVVADPASPPVTAGPASSPLAVGPTGPPLFAGSIPQQARPTYSEYGERIEAARRVVLEGMDRFPGLSVSVGVDGQIVWAEGFGWADLEQRVPVRSTSGFRVGSVAKPMTAALLGLLYEEGKINLDATVQTYVADFPTKEYPITIRQLAGHLAGIRHYRGTEFLSSVHYETVSDGLAIFADDPLLFEPGTRYSYSSYGWNLLSAVIEGATREGFLEQMQRRVFEPLGMLDTTPDQNEMIVADRVRPYARGDDGKLRNAPYADNSYKWAGGGFLSTAGDLVRFGLAHMEPGFLEAETLDEWFTSQRTVDGEETGYGIGWNVSGQAGRRRVGHGGGSVGGTTVLRVYRDQGLVIAMVTNLSNGSGFPVEEIAEIFLR
jgi:CubicO group peptidase (beta-lactamase class C family)